MNDRKCKCGRPAVVKLTYSNETLCFKCFRRSLIKRVKKTISKYSMLSPFDRICVALSGGKDSLTLLDLLILIEKDYPDSEIIAVTVDEGIEGYRDKSIKIASTFCKKMEIEHIIVSFKGEFGYTLDELVSKARKMGFPLQPCSICGVLRRRLINVVGRNVNADKIATAHNMDDEAQSILMNILRSDVERFIRLSPSPIKVDPRLVPRIKPLRNIPEREIAIYAYLRGLEIHDVNCPYAQYSFRIKLRRLLNEFDTQYPGIKPSILRFYDKIMAKVKIQRTTAIPSCSICGEPAASDPCKVCQLLSSLI